MVHHSTDHGILWNTLGVTTTMEPINQSNPGKLLHFIKIHIYSCTAITSTLQIGRISWHQLKNIFIHLNWTVYSDSNRCVKASRELEIGRSYVYLRIMIHMFLFGMPHDHCKTSSIWMMKSIFYYLWHIVFFSVQAFCYIGFCLICFLLSLIKWYTITFVKNQQKCSSQ